MYTVIFRYFGAGDTVNHSRDQPADFNCIFCQTVLFFIIMELIVAWLANTYRQPNYLHGLQA